MAARFIRATEAWQKMVPIEEIALAIQTRDVERVMRLLPVKEVRDKLDPVVTTMNNAYRKGGEIAQKEVNTLL